MTQEPLTLYKLIILYMLEKVDFPLTTAQISEFILEQGYTNFLTLQQALSELTEAGLISSKTVRNRTRLTNTKEGSETLQLFSNRISEAIRTDIIKYFYEKEIELRSEANILADYYKSTSGEFEVHMVARDKDTLLVDLTLSVPDEAMAKQMCENWDRKNQEIYQYLMEQLL
ncbi:MAG: DUF4364 family protein [Lachnospiraceae bacterium]|nr:DUF4364 family protein [Lachnospiraceae bacterium]MBR3762653.1 DUF4364 family protein [Lachnospiraceae bacterium]